MNNNKKTNKNFWDKIIEDPDIRREVTKNNPLLFFQMYFPRHLKYEMAPFHKEILGIMQETSIRNAVIEAFRGSGKTTLISLVYAIWSIVGCQQKKFVLILAQTYDQARQYLANIKRKLEEAENLLLEDMGPFYSPDDEWRESSIVIPKYGARIAVASIDKPVRGSQHGENRPDLIICDDLEDLDTVKKKESRDKIYNWLLGDVIPLGDKDTRLIVVGTRLHEESLIARLSEAIRENKMSGITKSYPLLDKDGNIAWPGKFPTKKDIDELRKNIPSESAWQREYLLKLISDDEPIVKKELIKYYNVMPKLTGEHYRETFIGVDPSGSAKENADCTAMVAASIFGNEDDIGIFIHPYPLNKRLEFNEIKEQAILLSKTLGGGCPATLIVEDVAVQKWLIQEIEHIGLPVEAFRIGGVDKRSRLRVAASLMQAGRVYFPKQGAEDLIRQLIGFGLEKHDDLADAFSLLLLKIMDIKNRPEPRMTIYG